MVYIEVDGFISKITEGSSSFGKMFPDAKFVKIYDLFHVRLFEDININSLEIKSPPLTEIQVGNVDYLAIDDHISHLMINNFKTLKVWKSIDRLTVHIESLGEIKNAHLIKNITLCYD